MKTYQEWCVNTIYQMMLEGRGYQGFFNEHGYKYVIKAMICHFASMYCFAKRLRGGGTYVNLWWNNISEDTLAPLLVSKAAYELFPKYIVQRGTTRPKQKLQKIFHIEHVTPMGYIYNRLQKVFVDGNITVDKVNDCFAQNKIIFITKSEVKILDGAGARFTQDDFNIFQRYFKGRFSDDFQEEIKKTCGGNVCPKSNGPGILRMIKLYNEDVRFVTGRGVDVDIGEGWINYLTNYTNTMDYDCPSANVIKRSCVKM